MSERNSIEIELEIELEIGKGGHSVNPNRYRLDSTFCTSIIIYEWRQLYELYEIDLYSKTPDTFWNC
jgi:hypothetical protein